MTRPSVAEFQVPTMTAREMLFWVWVVASFISQNYMMAKMAHKMMAKLHAVWQEGRDARAGFQLRCTPTGAKLHRARCHALGYDDGVLLRFCADCFHADGFPEDVSEVSFLEDGNLHSVLTCPKILGRVKQMNLCQLCSNSKLRVD